MFGIFKSKNKKSWRVKHFTELERSVLVDSLQRVKIYYTNQPQNSIVQKKLIATQKLIDELRIYVR